MALSSPQLRQAVRIPTPDTNVNKADKYSFLGIIQPLSPTLTSYQKKQILRLPVPDTTVGTSDQFAFLGLMEPLNTGGPTVEFFNLDWYIDPNWTANLIPVTNTGFVAPSLSTFTLGFPGRFEALEIVVPNEGTTIENTNASTYRSNFEIDDRTGFKKYPSWHPLSRVVRDGYGWRTDSRSADDRHPQEFVRARGNDKADGPQFAEPDNTFVSTSVSPEDL